jgi:hypothetical protein
MNKLASFFVFLVFLISQNSALAAGSSIDQLSWLAGQWSQVRNQVETEEYWIAPKGGVMLGVNRTGGDGRASEFEFLRIVERDGTLVYIASPDGRPPVEFIAIQADASKVVFENKKHDFPTRVIYMVEAKNSVLARIEGMVNGEPRSVEWRFTRMP